VNKIKNLISNLLIIFCNPKKDLGPFFREKGENTYIDVLNEFVENPYIGTDKNRSNLFLNTIINEIEAKINDLLSRPEDIVKISNIIKSIKQPLQQKTQIKNNIKRGYSKFPVIQNNTGFTATFSITDLSIASGIPENSKGDVNLAPNFNLACSTALTYLARYVKNIRFQAQSHVIGNYMDIEGRSAILAMLINAMNKIIEDKNIENIGASGDISLEDNQFKPVRGFDIERFSKLDAAYCDGMTKLILPEHPEIINQINKKKELFPFLFYKKENSLFYGHPDELMEIVYVKSIPDILEKIFSIKEEEFKKYIDNKIKEQKTDNTFKETIAKLTENFEGREEEIEKIKQFCVNGRGFLIFWGEPGIGKSSLIAQTLKKIKEEENENDLLIIEYFINKPPTTDDIKDLIYHLNKRIDILFDLKGMPKAYNIHELAEGFRERLEKIEKQNNARRLLILIDGLDELNELNKLNYIIHQKDFLSIIFTSRKIALIDDKYYSYNLKHETLYKLDEKSIKKILEKFIDANLLTENYIKKVLDKSDGNALYIHHLCDEIKSNKREPSDIESLPKGLKRFFKEIIQKLSNRDTDVIKLLCLLAEIKEAISIQTIKDFLTINKSVILEILDKCKEIITKIKDITTEEITYNLHHESLREVIKDFYEDECSEIQKEITSICFEWTKLKGRTRLYALKYALEHLCDLKKQEEMWELLNNPEYIEEQFKTFNHYEITLETLRKGINFYTQFKNPTPVEEGRLCWLALKTGDVANKAHSDINEIFEWAKEGKMDEALKRLEILDEQNFFTSAILLLWLERDSQEQLQKQGQNVSYIEVHKILDKIEEKIPQEFIKLFDKMQLSSEFMIWFIVHILTVFPEIDLSCLIYRTSIDIIELLKTIETYGLNKQIFARTLLITKNIEDESLATKLINLKSQSNLNNNKNVRENPTNVYSQAQLLSLKAEAMANSWNIEKAKENFDKAFIFAEQIEDFSDKCNTLISIAETIAKFKDIKDKDILFIKAFTVVINGPYGLTQSSSMEAIAAAMAKSGYLDKSLTVIEQIMAIYGDCKEAIISSIIKEFAKAEYVENKDILLNKIVAIVEQNKNISSATISLIVKIIATTGNFDKAREFFKDSVIKKHIFNISDKLQFMSLLAEVIANIGYFDEAKEIVDKAITKAETILDENKKFYALFLLISNTANFAEALKFIEQVRDENKKISGLTKILEKMLNSNFSICHPELVSGSFNKILDIAETIDDLSDKCQLLSLIAEAIGKIIDVKESQKIFETALRLSEKIQRNTTKCEVLISIAKAMVNTENFDKAREISDRIFVIMQKSKYHFIKSETVKETDIVINLVKVINNFKESKNKEYLLTKTLQIAEQNIIYHKTHVLSVIAEAVFNTGDFDKTKKIIAKALQFTKQIADDADKIMALTPIAQVVAKIGNRDELDEILSKIYTLVDNIKNNKQKIIYSDLGLGSLAETISEIGYLDKAKQIFFKTCELIENNSVDRRGVYLNEIANSMIKVGLESIFVEYLKKRNLHYRGWQIILCSSVTLEKASSWRKNLYKYASNPLPLLRDSLNYYPFDFKIAYEGVYFLLLAYVKSGNIDVFNSILEYCPQLIA